MPLPHLPPPPPLPLCPAAFNVGAAPRARKLVRAWAGARAASRAPRDWARATAKEKFASMLARENKVRTTGLTGVMHAPGSLWTALHTTQLLPRR